MSELIMILYSGILAGDIEALFLAVFAILPAIATIAVLVFAIRELFSREF